MRLSELAVEIRSKNAGPFWVTIDLLFYTQAAYDQAMCSERVSPAYIANMAGLDGAKAKIFHIDNLKTIKISAPRIFAQGYRHELDMHAGQMYVALLDIQL